MEDREDDPAARLGAGHPQQQGDRGAERQERRGDEGQEHVLEHVDREEGRVVALDDRLERDLDRREAAQEADHPDPRDRMGRVGRVHVADRPEVGRGDQQERDRDERIERPVEQDVRRSRGDERVRAVGLDGRRREQPQDRDHRHEDGPRDER